SRRHSVRSPPACSSPTPRRGSPSWRSPHRSSSPRSSARSAPRSATCLRSKLLPQQPVDDLRVRLASGLLHDLADEEAEHALLAPAVGLDLLRVGDEYRVDD